MRYHDLTDSKSSFKAFIQLVLNLKIWNKSTTGKFIFINQPHLFSENHTIVY